MRYVHKFVVNAPINVVAGFHQDTRVLKLLTPPPLRVKLGKIEPMAEGSEAEFTMFLGPLSIKWLAVHSNVDYPKGFTDTQLEGPFINWVHDHKFIPMKDDKTLVVDEINAELGDEPVNRFLSFFMWVNLPVLFFYRKLKTIKMIKKINKLNSIE